MAGETEWFECDAGAKPTVEGVYQVQGPEWGDRTLYARWYKGQWCTAMPELHRAAEQSRRSILMHERGCRWRGLLEEAK